MRKLNKKFVYGTGSAMIIAGACVVIILINIIASLLTDKFGLKIDVTETRYLDFSDGFVEFIKTVDKDVDVYYLVNPNEVTRVVNKTNDKNVVSIVDVNNYRVMMKEIVVEGLLSIQAGENPRIIEEKLKSFISPDRRKNIGEKEEAGE